MKTVQKKKNFYKNTKGKNIKRLARVTDEHCGKNDIKELQVKNFKIRLNNYICKTIYKKYYYH